MLEVDEIGDLFRSSETIIFKIIIAGFIFSDTAELSKFVCPIKIRGLKVMCFYLTYKLKQINKAVV